MEMSSKTLHHFFSKAKPQEQHQGAANNTNAVPTVAARSGPDAEAAGAVAAAGPTAAVAPTPPPAASARAAIAVSHISSLAAACRARSLGLLQPATIERLCHRTWLAQAQPAPMFVLPDRERPMNGRAVTAIAIHQTRDLLLALVGHANGWCSLYDCGRMARAAGVGPRPGWHPDDVDDEEADEDQDKGAGRDDDDDEDSVISVDGDSDAGAGTAGASAGAGGAARPTHGQGQAGRAQANSNCQPPPSVIFREPRFLSPAGKRKRRRDDGSRAGGGGASSGAGVVDGSGACQGRSGGRGDDDEDGQDQDDDLSTDPPGVARPLYSFRAPGPIKAIRWHPRLHYAAVCCDIIPGLHLFDVLTMAERPRWTVTSTGVVSGSGSGGSGGSMSTLAGTGSTNSSGNWKDAVTDFRFVPLADNGAGAGPGTGGASSAGAGAASAGSVAGGSVSAAVGGAGKPGAPFSTPNHPFDVSGPVPARIASSPGQTPAAIAGSQRVATQYGLLTGDGHGRVRLYDLRVLSQGSNAVQGGSGAQSSQGGAAAHGAQKAQPGQAEAPVRSGPVAHPAAPTTRSGPVWVADITAALRKLAPPAHAQTAATFEAARQASEAPVAVAAKQPGAALGAGATKQQATAAGAAGAKGAACKPAAALAAPASFSTAAAPAGKAAAPPVHAAKNGTALPSSSSVAASAAAVKSTAGASAATAKALTTQAEPKPQQPSLRLLQPVMRQSWSPEDLSVLSVWTSELGPGAVTPGPALPVDSNSATATTTTGGGGMALSSATSSTTGPAAIVGPAALLGSSPYVYCMTAAGAVCLWDSRVLQDGALSTTRSPVALAAWDVYGAIRSYGVYWGAVLAAAAVASVRAPAVANSSAVSTDNSTAAGGGNASTAVAQAVLASLASLSNNSQRVVAVHVGYASAGGSSGGIGSSSSGVAPSVAVTDVSIGATDASVITVIHSTGMVSVHDMVTGVVRHVHHPTGSGGVCTTAGASGAGAIATLLAGAGAAVAASPATAAPSSPTGPSPLQSTLSFLTSLWPGEQRTAPEQAWHQRCLLLELERMEDLGLLPRGTAAHATAAAAAGGNVGAGALAVGSAAGATVATGGAGAVPVPPAAPAGPTDAPANKRTGPSSASIAAALSSRVDSGRLAVSVPRGANNTVVTPIGHLLIPQRREFYKTSLSLVDQGLGPRTHFRGAVGALSTNTLLCSSDAVLALCAVSRGNAVGDGGDAAARSGWGLAPEAAPTAPRPHLAPRPPSVIQHWPCPLKVVADVSGSVYARVTVPYGSGNGGGAGSRAGHGGGGGTHGADVDGASEGVGHGSSVSAAAAALGATAAGPEVGRAAWPPQMGTTVRSGVTGRAGGAGTTAGLVGADGNVSAAATYVYDEYGKAVRPPTQTARPAVASSMTGLGQPSWLAAGAAASAAVLRNGARAGQQARVGQFPTAGDVPWANIPIGSVSALAVLPGRNGTRGADWLLVGTTEGHLRIMQMG